MSVVRNCIDIVGITSENELPKKINGQLIETSETENLFINANIKMKDIYQIIIDTSIKQTRIINTPINKIIVIDICKKFKIAYYDIDNNMGILELNSPCNLFFDIEDDKIELEKTNLYIADAYFELVNSNVLYNYILYIIDINYLGTVKRPDKTNSFNNYYINKNNDNCDFQNNSSEEENVKNYILKEVSISEDNKREFEEEKQLYSNVKNELIDIEEEYL